MNDVMAAVMSIVAMTIGLATLAVVLSKNANTTGVIQSSATGLSTIIGAAVQPIASSSGTMGLGGTSGSNG